MYKFSVAKHISLTNNVPSFVATICWTLFQAFIDQHDAGCPPIPCGLPSQEVIEGMPQPRGFNYHCRCYQTCPVNPNKTKHVETSTFDKSGAGSSHTSDYTAGIRAPRCRSSAAMRGATVTVCQCFSLPVPMDTLFSQGWMPWS